VCPRSKRLKDGWMRFLTDQGTYKVSLLWSYHLNFRASSFARTKAIHNRKILNCNKEFRRTHLDSHPLVRNGQWTEKSPFPDCGRIFRDSPSIEQFHDTNTLSIQPRKFGNRFLFKTIRISQFDKLPNETDTTKLEMFWKQTTFKTGKNGQHSELNR